MQNSRCEKKSHRTARSLAGTCSWIRLRAANKSFFVHTFNRRSPRWLYQDASNIQRRRERDLEAHAPRDDGPRRAGVAEFALAGNGVAIVLVLDWQGFDRRGVRPGEDVGRLRGAALVGMGL